MWTASPPFRAVTLPVGLPAVMSDTPHGRAFCGSPNAFASIHESGDIRIKWAEAGAAASSKAETQMAAGTKRFMELASLKIRFGERLLAQPANAITSLWTGLRQLRVWRRLTQRLARCPLRAIRRGRKSVV